MSERQEYRETQGEEQVSSLAPLLSRSGGSAELQEGFGEDGYTKGIVEAGNACSLAQNVHGAFQIRQGPDPQLLGEFRLAGEEDRRSLSIDDGLGVLPCSISIRIRCKC